MGVPATGPGHYLRDMVLGASDGIVTTFSIVAATVGGGFPPLVAAVLGAANLVADGISMAAGSWLGITSELAQRGEPRAVERPARHAGATFGAFLVAGAIPLGAFLAPLPFDRFLLASLLAGASLALVGALRKAFLPRSAWRLAAEMLAVGGAAGAAAFGIGSAVAFVLGA